MPKFSLLVLSLLLLFGTLTPTYSQQTVSEQGFACVVALHRSEINSTRKFDSYTDAVLAKRAERDARIASIPHIISLEKDGHIIERHSFWLIPGYQFLADEKAIALLQRNRELVVEACPELKPASDDPTFATNPKDAIHSPALLTGAPTVWAKGFTGKGIRIGLIDSGIDTKHPLLQKSLYTWESGPYKGKRAFYNLQTNLVATPKEFGIDGSSHGTTIAGSIVAGAATNTPTGLLSEVPLGIAPDAKLIVAANVYQSPSPLLKALEWMADPDGDATNDDAPHMLSLSYGTYGLKTAKSYAAVTIAFETITQDLSISVFQSIGNDGIGSTIPMTNTSPIVHTVGASEANGQRALFSSKGPGWYHGNIWKKPDTVLFGTNLFLPVSQGFFIWAEPEPNTPTLYKYISGTSFSTPMTAAVAALVQQAHHSLYKEYLSPQQLSSLLQHSSVHTDNKTVKNNETGAGLLTLTHAIDRIVSGQFTKVKGTVVNEAGQGVPYTAITYGTPNGSQEISTDRLGSFSLVLPTSTDTLLLYKASHQAAIKTITPGGAKTTQLGTIPMKRLYTTSLAYPLTMVLFESNVIFEQKPMTNLGSAPITITGIVSDAQNIYSDTLFPLTLLPYESTLVTLLHSPGYSATQAIAFSSSSMTFASNAQQSSGNIPVGMIQFPKENAPPLWGDVDTNGAVNIDDVLCMHYQLGFEKSIPGCNFKLETFDVNCDAIFSLSDLFLLQKELSLIDPSVYTPYSIWNFLNKKTTCEKK